MKKACLVITGFLILLIVISVIFAVFQKNVPMGDKVAVVRIEGPIMDSKSATDEIKGYLKDPSIKALVLRVD
ncbi:MAG: signal peptide peptidase SppA, partial [Nitrospirae bacterium]|nr:signal peptide peptidase SppA [Nitrospirota bacterium]